MQEKQAPYDLAMENGYTEIATLITDHLDKAGSKNKKIKPPEEKQRRGVNIIIANDSLG